DQNTNVVELHSRVDRDNQNKYYNCGIGTYVPDGTKSKFQYVGQWINHIIDLAIARTQKRQTLQEHYFRGIPVAFRYNQPGDKIFLFGEFSC
ncbi:hypothetical protein C8R44DRAFT_643410, partial [Mycena epipterygia]